MSSNTIDCSGNGRVCNVKQTFGKNFIKVSGNARVEQCTQKGSSRQRKRRRHRSRSPKPPASSNIIAAADSAVIKHCTQSAPGRAANVLQKDGNAQIVGCIQKGKPNKANDQ